MVRGERVYILEVLVHHYREQGCVQDICTPESAGLAVLILYLEHEHIEKVICAYVGSTANV